MININRDELFVCCLWHKFIPVNYDFHVKNVLIQNVEQFNILKAEWKKWKLNL